MKSTGIVRKIDELGRVVLPKELRKSLNIQEKDPIEIFVDQERIILRKYSSASACMVTGEVTDDNFTLFDGKVTLSPEGAKQIVEELQQVNK
ncbi:AbrB/MazE/SpoVT family DNA-binding domain-containing protein [Gracilibacillus caseinilyticus]|uniref:AbrB/MazE/SpoVT family DNA-binding domain-containing protein n=1 Tax=Gracilibacillus caseinilyticus TaxID=2932256 RepID=A0ABY4EZ58_9BACI|nr:AbrB/MazE/SpoVT family DNA-binding domain-containing protein [Gracilibacillus caseinilyticus]UOQ49686.1 AbrB/MazE/SpoVT family DNA-binding domain-containing protein [Gracilibacillus caseinilyticus]